MGRYLTLYRWAFSEIRSWVFCFFLVSPWRVFGVFIYYFLRVILSCAPFASAVAALPFASLIEFGWGIMVIWASYVAKTCLAD